MKITIDGDNELYDYKVIFSNNEAIASDWVDVKIESEGSSVVNFTVSVKDLYRVSNVFEEMRLENPFNR